MAESDNLHRRHSPGAAANGWLVVVLVVLLAVLMFRTVNETLSNRSDYTPRTVTPRGELAAEEQSTIQVFEQASQSVVFVKTKGYQPMQFGNAPTEELSSGTGFVWDEEGHIVTNLHVIQQALETDQTALEVALGDAAPVEAEFIGGVYQHDIAVLRIKVKPSELHPITLGTSNDLKVGQRVHAIGNPFGFDRTLSSGVIGGLNRSMVINAETSEFLEGLIQTDAAINPGNSGGPLLDSSGRLIGVNTAIVSNSGQSAGLGFAVPVKDVMDSVNRVLSEAGQKQPAALGIALLTEESAQTIGLSKELYSQGPIIRRVFPMSAAAEAKLQETQLSYHPLQGYRFRLGDQIISIDDVRIRTFEDLTAALSSRAPGDMVRVTLIREGTEFSVNVTLKAPRILL
ncbi:MAG: trypsin-like peptidase domain-containing protein [Planctomyces sp.]|nr:trypsin-like peptidase domain-containing protein [Planctomyces sp.]